VYSSGVWCAEAHAVGKHIPRRILTPCTIRSLSARRSPCTVHDRGSRVLAAIAEVDATVIWRIRICCGRVEQSMG